MKVLSLFDGMSCGQIALNKAEVNIDKYYAAEVDNYAITVTQANYPNTIQLGDVCKVKGADLPKIDLLIGGSPCQGFSFAGKQLNFEDPRSALFFEYVRILAELRVKNPDIYFLLENVRMKKESQDVITEYLGVEPIEINSALVSAQNRRRLYWTNIEGIEQPEDKGILLRDILEFEGAGVIKNMGDLKDNGDKSQCLDANYFKGADNHGQRTLISLPLGRYADAYDITARFNAKKPGTLAFSKSRGSIRTINDKSKTLLGGGQNISNSGATNIKIGERYRTLSPLECELLQTVPDNYTNHVSNTQRYKMLGNGWTVDVITHIFKNMFYL